MPEAAVLAGARAGCAGGWAWTDCSVARSVARGRGAGTRVEAAVVLLGEAEVACGRGACAGGREEGRGVATGSAERVTVPFRVKFWRSRGPIASVAGVSPAAACVVASWASAGIGASASVAAKAITPKRKTALINSRFLLVNRATKRAEPMPS